MSGTDTRTSTVDGTSARPRFTGLLPNAMLRWRRPSLWQEVVIIAFGYWLYSLGRNAIPRHDAVAYRHGTAIEHLQDQLHVNFELAFNHFVAAHEWLAQTMDYYYATLHFIVTPAVMIWLFWRHSHVYRGARTVLVATTLLALLGFYVYPTAPPRLLSGLNYVDTVDVFHTWGSLADPNVAAHSNQYAAMPSLHLAWALWCGVVIFRCARHLWIRLIGLAYPVGTFLVIVGTANHFVLDAAAGAFTLAVGFGVQYLLSGHGAFAPPVGAPDEGPVPAPPHEAATG